MIQLAVQQHGRDVYLRDILQNELHTRGFNDDGTMCLAYYAGKYHLRMCFGITTAGRSARCGRKFAGLLGIWTAAWTFSRARSGAKPGGCCGIATCWLAIDLQNANLAANVNQNNLWAYRQEFLVAPARILMWQAEFFCYFYRVQVM